MTQPVIKVSFTFFPFFLTNFVTSENGDNKVVEELQAMCSVVSKEMIRKIQTVVAMYCEERGIQLEDMNEDEIRSGISLTLKQDSLTQTNIRAIYNKDSKELVQDDDYFKHISSGRTDS